MQDNRTFRALSWIGGGGAVVASASLIAAAVFAAVPDTAAVARSNVAGKTGAARLLGPQGLSSLYPGAANRNQVSASGRSRSTAGSAKRASAPLAPTPSTASTAAPAAPPATNLWTTSLEQERLAAPIVAAASGHGGQELLLAGADGGLFPVGEAGFYGSLGGSRLAGRIAAVATNPSTGGYWLAGSDGGVFAFHAPYRGTLSGHRLSAPVVAMAATPSGNGYWLAAADGGVFAFGDARYAGNLSKTHLTSPIVAMAATPSGNGYWLAAADGGVFAFGDARYAGNLSKTHLTSPIVAMAATPSGNGYWLAAADGGVFAFGQAAYDGNAVGRTADEPIAALVPSSDGLGYWLAGSAGSVFAFGDAPTVGQTASPAAVAAAALPVVDPSTPKVAVSHITTYPAGAVGQDISQYQCSDIPPAGAGIAVVQVTGGAIDSAPNPCYVNQARWAGSRLSTYIYMDGLPEPAPASSLIGPAGVCALINAACESFNYGYNWARHWVAYSRSAGVDPAMWWLDVERYSGWRNTISNSLVINGALQGLQSMGVKSGLYSTRAQWNQITGGLTVPGIPLWTPGAGNQSGPGYSADSFCADPGSYSFAGGSLKIVQFGYQGPFPGSYAGASPYDLDLACR